MFHRDGCQLVCNNTFHLSLASVEHLLNNGALSGLGLGLSSERTSHLYRPQTALKAPDMPLRPFVSSREPYSSSQISLCPSVGELGRREGCCGLLSIRMLDGVAQVS